MQQQGTLPELNEQDIADALGFIDADDRETWLRMAMAVKSELGDAGFEIWDAWSRQSNDYSERDARHVWKSCKAHGRITIGTLLYEAQQEGFKLQSGERLSAEQAEERARQREEARRKSEVEERQRRSDAAALANRIWDAADPAASHPYLDRKGVAAHGLRIGKWPLFKKDGQHYATAENVLLIPIRDSKGNITTLQGVFDVKPYGYEGDKTYLRDGQKSGSFHIIGQPGDGGTIALVEGYATGATVRELTGWCVVVCFDRTNLKPVAEQFRKANPSTLMVICADNDADTKDNPGVTNAKLAGAAVNARVIIPEFEGMAGTDFNDLAAISPDEARRQLTAHQTPKPANDNKPAEREQVDVYTPLVDINHQGKPLATIDNLAEVCSRIGVTIRYNVISKEEEVLIPGESFLLDNQANASLALLESWCAKFRMPTGNLASFVTYLADKNPYNPVANWILSKPWDGQSRLQALFDTVQEKQPRILPDGRRLRDVLIFRWLLSAVDAAFNPNGVSAHGVLVFQGDQYVGKTKWFKQLAPADLNVIKEGVILKPDDRDSVKQACSFWLVELGELDSTFRKSDIAALKAFITNRTDVLRRAYARKESQYARRTVFFGSVNPKEFLHDPTGNRRYWTIELASLVLDHGIDMQQLWAEVYQLLQQGHGYYLTQDEMNALNAHNEDFQVIDPIEERIQTKLLWTAPPVEWEWLTATEVLLKVGVDRPNQSDATKAAHSIRKLNGGNARKSNGKNLLLVPPLAKQYEAAPY